MHYMPLSVDPTTSTCASPKQADTIDFNSSTIDLRSFSSSFERDNHFQSAFISKFNLDFGSTSSLEYDAKRSHSGTVLYSTD